MIAIAHVPSPHLNQCQLTHLAAQAIDLGRAATQHSGYLETLENLGVRVVLLDANRDFPDSVFVEDTAVVLDEVAIIATMGTSSRRGEPPAIEQELRRHREVRRIEQPGLLEGGDILRIGKRLLVGVSSRTDRDGIEALREIVEPFGYQVSPVPVHGCLHLKTACTALPDGRLFVNRRWLEMEALAEFECLDVPEDEPFAANLLLVGEVVCLAAAHPQTVELVHHRGFQTRTVDISEFAKAEGAMTCLSLLFQADP